MIVAKCCRACGTQFDKSQLHNGLCPWCDEYHSTNKLDLFASVFALGVLVFCVLGITWLFVQ